jgi:hypothetical protein
MKKRVQIEVGLLMLYTQRVFAQGGSNPGAPAGATGVGGSATIDNIPGMINDRVQPWLTSPVWLAILIVSLMVMAVLHWQGTGRLAEIGIKICIAAAVVGGAPVLVGIAAGTS